MAHGVAPGHICGDGEEHTNEFQIHAAVGKDSEGE
jgi:hypothetical protein